MFLVVINSKIFTEYIIIYIKNFIFFKSHFNHLFSVILYHKYPIKRITKAKEGKNHGI